MNQRITDDDILALIEDELPADRRAAVGAALRDDPTLRARVEGMIRDARALARDRAEPPSAPAGIVARAIEESAQPAGVAPKSKRRFAMAAIITLAMVGVWGAILYATFGPDVGAGNPAELRPKRYVMMDEDQARHMQTVLVPLEQSIYLPEPEGSETLGELIAETTQNLDAVELDPEIERMLDEFTQLADAEKPMEELAPRLAALLRLDPKGPALTAVIEAARDNRLRVLVAGRDIADLSSFVEQGAEGRWMASAAPLPTAGHDFVRDYAKPGPGQETRAPEKADAAAPDVIRVRLTLTQAADDAARDRDTARALEALLSSWAAPAREGAPVRVRFVIERSPIPLEASADGESGAADDPAESDTRFSVLFERDHDSTPAE